MRMSSADTLLLSFFFRATQTQQWTITVKEWSDWWILGSRKLYKWSFICCDLTGVRMEESRVPIKFCEAGVGVYCSDMTLSFRLRLWKISGIQSMHQITIQWLICLYTHTHTCNLVCGTGLCCLLEVSLGVECWRSKLSLCPKTRKYRQWTLGHIME